MVQLSITKDLLFEVVQLVDSTRPQPLGQPSSVTWIDCRCCCFPERIEKVNKWGRERRIIGGYPRVEVGVGAATQLTSMPCNKACKIYTTGFAKCIFCQRALKLMLSKILIRLSGTCCNRATFYNICYEIVVSVLLALYQLTAVTSPTDGTHLI